MHRNLTTALTAFALFMVGGSLGCVTQGTYDEAVTKASDLEQQVEQLNNKIDSKNMEIASLTAAHARLESALEAEVAAGLIEIQKSIDGVTLGVAEDLLFQAGSTALSASGRNVLGRIAGELKGGRETIFVEGHSDSFMISKSLEAKYPSNWELAGARAAKVVRRLSAEGVDPKRLRAVSRGPFDPIASNDTSQGRKQNRRTEIILRPMQR